MKLIMLIPLLLAQTEEVPVTTIRDDVSILVNQADTLKILLEQVESGDMEDLQEHLMLMQGKIEGIEAVIQARLAIEGVTVDSLAPPIRPVDSVWAMDAPYDAGTQLVVRWIPSPDDEKLDAYVVYRCPAESDEEFQQIAVLPSGADSVLTNNENYEPNIEAVEDRIAALNRNLPRAIQSLPRLKILGRPYANGDSLSPAVKNRLIREIFEYRKGTVRQLELDMNTAILNYESVQMRIDSLQGILKQETGKEIKEYSQDVNSLIEGIYSIDAWLKQNDEMDLAQFEMLKERLAPINIKIGKMTYTTLAQLKAEREGLDAEIETLRSMISGITNLTEADLKEYKDAQVENYQNYIASAEAMLITNRTPYVFKVAAVKNGQEVLSKESAPAFSTGQWFHVQRTNILIAMLVFFFLVLFFLFQARKGKEMFLRRIAGLEEIDNAVGRATEMGRPILFVSGIGGISNIATIAALNILTGVAKKAAQYDTPIIVPNADPIVYTVAREIVKEAYSDVGRPDAFNPDSVFFITTNQFAYVSAVNGIMLREKPATNFFLGYFAAESLLLAETGNIAGSIQIAGTASSAQLPFFITACDYTLIGEELFAASAYISRQPDLVAAIKAQDWGKVIIGGLLILLAILAIIGVEFATRILTTV